MERAADGLEEAGKALAGLYNAAAQALPIGDGHLGRTLDLAERGVVALESIAASLDQDGDK